MPMLHESDNVVPVMEGPLFQAALDRVRPRLDGMTESQVNRTPRLDPTATYQVASGTSQKLAPYRGALVEQFGPRAGELVEGLPIVAAAARQADIDFMAARDPRDIAALHRELMKRYRLLITDCESLVNRGHLPEDAFDKARDLKGYQACIDSTLVAVRVLRARWPQIEPHTPLTVADVDRAEAIAVQVSQAISTRDHGITMRPARELRFRALSALVSDYEELRRMMSFLRWYEGDVDEIVPSLYAGRGGRGTPDVEPASDEPATPTDGAAPGSSPSVPMPVNGSGPFTQ